MAMNLGDARLSHVTASKPQLNRADSRQSVAASDDYYSISDQSSTDRETVIRYQTPPLSNRSNENLQASPMKRAEPLPTHEEVNEPLSRHASSQIPSHEKTWQDPHVDASAPTPGLDDSPYIHFAIDQITRDEEVAGRGRVSKDGRVTPTSPTIPRKAVHRSSQEPRVASSKYSSGNKDEVVAEPVSPITEQEPSLRSPLEKPMYIHQNAGSGVSSQLFPPLRTGEDRARPILLPAQPRDHDYRYPALRFVPGPLRLLPILALITFIIALVVILVISTVLGAKNYGLLGYDGVGTARYFIFEYLPQLLAVIVVVWLLVIQTTIQRILPFVILARAQGYPDRNVLERVPLYITNYLWPNTSLLRQGLALGFCSVTFWLALFTVPLASSLYQTRWYSQIDNGTFLWATVQPASIILIALYLLLIIALIITYIYFNRHTTGLKWDPITIADITVLLRRTSNLTSPRTSKTSKATRNSSVRPHSLGYWESTSHPGQIFYGIGAAHESPLNSNEKDSMDDPEARMPLQQSTFESWHSQHSSRGRTQPLFLRETFLILYAITAVALLIAFLVVTYLRSAVVTGFLPLVPTATGETSSFTSFSPSNFLYSFMPSFIGLLLALFWLPIDTAFRYLKPWSTLMKQYPSSANQSYGHSARTTLLLSYPSALPFSATIRAVSHGHLRIAWFSAMSLMAWVVPVLAGGLFTAQFISTTTNPDQASIQDQSRGGNILIRPDTAALYVLTVFLILYAFTWLLTFPGVKTRAIFGPDGRPVDVRYLAGIRSVVDKSVLREAIWEEPRTRIDLFTRLVASDGPKSRISGRWAFVSGRVVRT